MRYSLSAQLTSRIMVVVLAMMIIIAAVVYYTVREYMLDEAQQRYKSVLLENHEEVRRHLADVYVATNNNIHDIERDIDNPDLLFAHMERIVRQNPAIVCCALLFVPNYYPSKGQMFVPCARQDSTGNIRVTRIDSTYHKYYNENWYQKRMKEDTSGWTDVYFESELFAGDEGRRLLTTYTIPVHNQEGRPVALLCADLSLEWLRNEMMEDMERVNHDFERNSKNRSYSFIVDRKGTYIIHLDREHMLKDKLVTDCTMTGEQGVAVASIDGITAWIYYRTVKYVDWTMVIVVPKDLILYNGRMLNIIIMATMLLGLAAIYLFCRHQIKEIADPLAAQKAVMERELNIAHNIQMAMLPPPLNVQQTPFTVHASLTPARDVGGDLYDYILCDNRLYFCIGDVSGKGVPAALLMAVVQTMFHNEAQHATRASDIIVAMNNIVCAKQNTTGFFVTMFVGILDLTTGNLDYCNAGHEAPILLSGKRETKSEKLPVKPNLPVGTLDDWMYEGQQVLMHRGDMLFLYTDGLSEAANPEGLLFGRRQVANLVQQYGNGTPQQLIDNMMEAVVQYSDTAEQFDDITMLAIRLEVKSERLEVPAVMDEMDHITDFASNAAIQAGMSKRETKRLRLAIEEAAANVVNYSGATSIRLTTAVDNGQLVLTISDDGQHFNPASATTPDLSIPADQRPPGGMGIVLLRQMTTSLDYQYLSGRNVLTIRKNIE